MSKNWIKYWRNSLADGERMERNLQKVDHFKIGHWSSKEGSLPTKESNKLIDKYEIRINREKGIEKDDEEDWIKINEAPIAVALFSIVPSFEHAKKASEKDEIHPFWFNARVNRFGQLVLPESKFPTFLRRVLDPAIDEYQPVVLGAVGMVDQIMGEGFPDMEKWGDYINFVSSFFKKVTGKEVSEPRFDNLKVKNETVVILDDKIDGASDGIIKLYDKLSQEENLPPLFQTLSDDRGQTVQPLIPAQKWNDHLSDHLGQMGNAFPLSFTQRQSLTHYSTLGHGNILGVNGPPGTGKTTLLQSVVADEYVKAAIEGGAPPVIVASSTNNQAVTNIIESFSKADSSHRELAERWLPDINSYALYLPSSPIEPKNGVHYTRTNGDGLPSTIETSEYLEKAESFYIRKAASLFNQSFDDSDGVVSHLHKRLLNIQKGLNEINSGWSEYLKIEELVERYSCKRKEEYYYNQTLNVERVVRDQEGLKSLLNDYYDIREKESFWLVLFSFIKFFREKRALPYKRIFQDTEIEFPDLDFRKVGQIEEVIKGKIELLDRIMIIETNWSELKAKYRLKSNPPSLFSELDQGLRHEAFLLATHYWEGRWLKETRSAIEEDILRKVGEPNMKRRFRRYAMLSPCFVVTFYMLPKFFIYKKYGGGTYPEYPLLDFIDLLIVDEAGQVTPEVGAASFALARKSIVVGDIKQIDPIWKIPKPIDHSNLEKFEVIKKGVTSEELDVKGFTASAGSIMRLAQNASHYHAAKEEAKGMMLVEHRRCFNEIIAYCNQLAYHGQLQPLRGFHSKQDKKYPLPPMGVIHIDGASTSENGSRMNEIEAVEIAKWLIENKGAIESFYQSPNKKFEDQVGIITPFTAQKHTLKKVLKKAGFDIKRLTIGTVHALQGAERPIILFSPVYASNEEGRSFFFDQGVNMLNVAVSRAKDSFLLFGDTKVLNPKAQSPSGLLIRHLMKNKT